MLALLLSSLLSLFFFITLGTFAAKVLRLPANFIEKALLGLVAANALSTIISLFFPVGGYALVLAILLCAALLFFIKNELLSLASKLKQKRTIILLALPFIALAFFISLTQPFNYDTGLYHIQAIKWIEAYPVIPGLANLYTRLGFNPNSFTFFALTSLFPVFGQEIFSVNFVVFSILTVYFINTLQAIFKTKGVSNIFLWFSILFVALLFLVDDLSSPTPDFLSIAIPIFIFARLIETAQGEDQRHKKIFIPIIILCCYVLTVKLATLPLLLLVILLLIKYRPGVKNIVLMLSASAIIVIPWLIRNVILTGWLVYPLPSVNLFSFDWQVPVASVILEKYGVTGWARDPGVHYVMAAKMGLAGWVPIWWAQLILRSKFLVISGFVCPLFIFATQFATKFKGAFIANAVIATAFFGVLFWFFLAPDFRFGRAFIVVAAFSPLLIFKFAYQPKKSMPYFVIVCAAFLGIQSIASRQFVITAADRFSTVIIKPDLLQAPADLKFKSYTINGITIYAPAKGNQCFCHDIPCIPNIDTTITTRGNTLMDGFRAKNPRP
jgi:hypothetical protein